MPDWKEQIAKSESYVLIITENFFKNVLCFDQASYAKDLGLPFRIALLEGMKIPKGYPVSDDINIEYHDGSLTSIREAITKLVEKDYPDGWKIINENPIFE